MSAFPSRLALIATEVMNPFALVAVVVTWVCWLTDPSWGSTAAVAIVFLAGVPLLASLVMTRLGAVTDRYIRHRGQRHLFYGLSLVSMLSGALLVNVMDSSSEARWMVNLAVTTLVAVMVINTWFKISIHALISALAAVVVPAGLPHPGLIVGSLAAWALVSWSRVRLSRHTLSEVVWGSALGAFVGFAFLFAVGGLQ